MKRWMSTCSVLACLALWATANAGRPFEDYQVILDRKPFGVPPEAAPEPERIIPIGESFAATLELTGLDEKKDGTLRVVITDNKDKSYFVLMQGGEAERGIELVDVDMDLDKVTIQQGDQVVELSMNAVVGGEVVPPSEIQERKQQAEERRLSYAERRRQRMIERQKPVEVVKPVFTGEELEKHLQEYQMEVLRDGSLPPLPVQLSAENDAKLVAEGVLPPVDEEGFEWVPEEEVEAEQYVE